MVLFEFKNKLVSLCLILPKVDLGCTIFQYWLPFMLNRHELSSNFNRFQLFAIVAKFLLLQLKLFYALLVKSYQKELSC